MFFTPVLSFGQTDNYGTEFWTGFMSNINSSSELRLFIAAKQNTSVTISVPLLSYSAQITVPKDSVAIFKIPNTYGQISTSEVVEKKGVHIVADYPVAITAMNLSPATTDATVVFPLKNVPSNATYVTGHPGKVSNMAGNEFLIVSTENGAQIEITPTARTTGGKSAFTPFYITLDQGEAYQVIAPRSENLDGSTIRSTNGKKIIVYTGDKCSAFPCGACDHQVEQVFPNHLLDTAYYVLPHFGLKKGYTVKVVSVDTTLWIKVNGKPYRIGKKDSALVLDVPSGDSVLHINGPRKFACFQFMKGPNCNGYITAGWGDPAILQLLSSKYMGQKSTFSAVNSTNLRDHFVSILIHTTSKNEVYLDGTKIAASEFIPVSHNNNFSYAKLKINLGVHTIECKQGHLAYCYGIGSYESYLYTAGFSLPNFQIAIKDSALIFDCKNNKVKMRFEAILEGAIKEYRWDFGDGTTDTNRIAVHSYPIGKEFSVKLWAKGHNNKVDSIIKKFIFNYPEFNPVFDKLLCDQKYTFEEKNPFFANFKWQDNSTKNYYVATKTEKLKVTATDTSGYCKFVDSAEVKKVGVISTVKVDTFSNCHLNNLFKFSDSSYVVNDSILYKAWIFPGGVTLYDTTNFYYHFRQPGKLMVYLDIYPKNAPCKSRIEIPVTVNWNTDIDAVMDREKYCDGDTATIKDLSYSCCQKVQRYYWAIDGHALVKSDSGKLKTRVKYDYVSENGIIDYKYVTETFQGCRDTIKTSLIVWPAAKAKFDFGKDSIKCLALSRWTFKHTVDENLTGPYTLLWNFGNGKTSSQNPVQNFRFTDTGTYTVKLKTTTAVGCVDSLTKKLKVIDNARAYFRLLDSVQCLNNNSVEVKDSSIGAKLNYVWDFGNGIFSNAQQPMPVQYLSPGRYKVKLKVNSPFAGCFPDSVVHKVNILTPPKADFVFTPGDTLCLNQKSVGISDRSQFYNGKYKTYWMHRGIDSAFQPNPIPLSGGGKDSVILHIKDLALCEDRTVRYFHVIPQPVVNFTINDTIQCFSMNYFEINSGIQEKTNPRAWYLNQNLMIRDSTKIKFTNLTPQGKYTLKLVETNRYGCVDSAEKSIEILPPLQADFKVNKDTQCFNDQSFDFTNSSQAPGDLISEFNYFDNTTLIASIADLKNHTFKTIGPQTVLFTIKSLNGCVDSMKRNVMVVENPEANFLGDTLCLGERVELKAIQTKGQPIVQWMWNMGDGSRFDPIFSGYTSHLYLKPGLYRPELSIKDKLNCYGLYKSAPVLIVPQPEAGFTIEKLRSDFQNNYVELIPKNSGYALYEWRFPDGTKQIGAKPLVTLPRFFNGRILLTVTGDYGCADTASEVFYIFPKLGQLHHENAFTPNGDLLNETFNPYNVEGCEQYVLRIFNRWGEQIFESRDRNMGWNGTYNHALVQAGVYIFTVEFIYADGFRYSTRGEVTVIR